MQEQFDKVNSQFKSEKEKLAEYDSELKGLEKGLKAKSKDYGQKELQIKQLSHDLERFNKEKLSAQESVRHMVEKHPWILDQKE
jgi:structural maintenance of chromosome 2